MPWSPLLSTAQITNSIWLNSLRAEGKWLNLGVFAILRADGSPVLSRQMRAGRAGQPFILLKLRTMTKVKRRDDAFPKPEEFPRSGRILRRISIDGLPQLINVLRGDMSVV